MYLTKVELFICLVIYTIFLSYGAHNVYSIKNKIIDYSKHEFTKGWDFIGHQYDDSSNEFECFKFFLIKNFLWYLSHVLLVELCKCFNQKHVPLIHAIVGITFIFSSYKFIYILFILGQYLSFYISSYQRSKIIIWILSFIWIIVIHFIKIHEWSNQELHEYYEFFQIVILLCWNVLKGLSFSLNKLDENEQNQHTNKFQELINYSGYFYYFPTFVFGPFIIYDRYGCILSDYKPTDIVDRLKVFTKELIKVGFWILFLNVSLHFLYIHYLERDFNAVKHLNFLGLYGFGYLMGLYFYFHYVTTYGLGIAFLRFDDINPPRLPICIGRVHFYSNMWKYFDQGLYEFLYKYIYISLCRKDSSVLRKGFASVATFSFIFVWHGLEDFILIWTALNFLCITLEKIFKLLITSAKYTNFVSTYLSIKNQERLYGFLGAHLFIPSVISNFYFFAGTETGNYFIKCTYLSGIYHYIILTSVCYCIFQSCEFVSLWEQKKKVKV